MKNTYKRSQIIALTVCLCLFGEAKALEVDFEKPMLLPLSSMPIEWSVHAQEFESHKDQRVPSRTAKPLPLSNNSDASFQDFPNTQSGSDLIVYGYLPYWEFDADIPWSEITHLGYFAVGASGSGSLSNDHGWGNAEQLALVEEAHEWGVRVDLVVTLFSESELQTLLSSATNRAVFANNLRDLAVLGNADGINLDFEGMPATVKSELVSFVLELSALLAEDLPDAQISLAVPAVDWAGAYDYDLLAEASDFLFIMCYGYHWTGGNPGPNAPIDSAGPWPHKSISWTIDDYIEWGGGSEVLDKLVIGLPSYGHDWPTTNDEIPGTKSSKGGARSYKNLQNSIGFENFITEPESGEKYYIYQDGDQWHQVFGDDGETTATKVEWILNRGVRGYGFWALGYDDNASDYWVPVRTAVYNSLGYPAETSPVGEDVNVPHDQGTATSNPEAMADTGAPVPQDETTPNTEVSNSNSDATKFDSSVNNIDASDHEEEPMNVVRESGGCTTGKPANKIGWGFLIIVLLFLSWNRFGMDRTTWVRPQRTHKTI